MFALIAAPGQYVRPRMRRDSSHLSYARTIVRCGRLPRGRTGVLLTVRDDIAGRLIVLEVATVPPQRRSCTVGCRILTTASVQNLTSQGLNKTSIKPGEILKVTILPARNGNPAGFIRTLTLGDREIKLFFGDERD